MSPVPQRPDSLEVDPRAVPKRRLYTGAKIPGIGLGTFGSDHVSGQDIARAVGGALACGYRHIDCAAVYGNEHLIGPVLEQAIQQGIARQDLWITSKLWNDKHTPDDVIAACRKSLRNLHLDYLDLYLVHWPFPNYHAPGCDVSSRAPNAQSYIHENFMKTWRAMEKLVDLGLTRHIGTSNMTIPKLSRVLRDARIKPACNEMELHPHFQQPEFFRFVQENDIVPIGFCPIGSPKRPDRDKTATDTADIEDPVIQAIAQRLRVHPAVVCVKWAAQRGQVPIPFSIDPHKYAGNLHSVTTNPLTDKEMEAICGIDKNCRLIKGQVFLWKDNQSWQDLWDQNGQITPP